MKEIARDNGWTDSSEPVASDPSYEQFLKECTPSSGEGPTESTFGQGDYTGLEGDFIQ